MERVRCGFLLFLVYSLAFIFILVMAPSFNSSTQASNVSKGKEDGHINSQNIHLAGDLSSSEPAVGGFNMKTTDDGSALFASVSLNESSDHGFGDEDEEKVYIVREGDTLSQIGEMYEVSANTIKWANDLKSDTIYKGQHLVILPFNGVRHQVESGDTISKIADKYDASEEEIKEFNEIWDDQKLATGHFIDVPGGVKEENEPQEKEEKKEPKPSYNDSVAYSDQSVSESSGYLMRPVKGGIRTQGLHGRNAVDIAAPTGTYIYAAAEGKVSVSGWHSSTGYGYYIVIDHPNGVSTLYAHHSKNLVGVGQWVSKGEVIAEMGNTGYSTGPHLHFEVHGAANPF
ncbi:MAG: peptidoglycan DD-metalloendopeptidase family protein [Patescibacteria group bacterium]